MTRQQAKTDYNKPILHLHVGTRKTPLTVYPTDYKGQRGLFTVMHGTRKWEAVPKSRAESIVGRFCERLERLGFADHEIESYLATVRRDAGAMDSDSRRTGAT